MADLYVKKIATQVGAVIVADGPDSQEVFDKLPFDRPLHCEVKQQRSLQHLKLYWSICHRIANALDRDDIDAEAVSDFFKKATGHYTVMQTQTQGEILRLDSISFTKMDQIAFRDFFERCIRFSVTEWGIPYEIFGDLLGEIGTEKR